MKGQGVVLAELLARAAEGGHVLDAAGHGLGLRRRHGVRDQRVHDLPRGVLQEGKRLEERLGARVGGLR